MKKWIALLSALLLTLSCAMAESSDTAHTEILSFDANPTTGYSWVGFVLGGEAVQLDSTEGTFVIIRTFFGNYVDSTAIE